MIEAYRIAATMALNVQPTLAGLDSVLGRFSQVMAAQKGVVDGMKAINAIMRDAGGAAKSYADNMERAARAASKLAAGGIAAPSRAAPSQPAPYVSTSTAMVYAPRLLAAPQRGYETQGPAYGPGRDLVPVGPGRQWDNAGPSPNRGALIIYNGPAGPKGPGTGFSTQGAPYSPQGGEVGPHLGPTGLTAYQRPPMNLPPLSAPRGPFPMGDAYAAAYGAERAGDAAGGLVTGAFNAAASVDALKGALAAQGFSKGQVEQAYAAAVKTQQSVLGSYVGKNLEIIGTLMALTQDPASAISLMPQAAKTATGFAGLGMGDGVAGLTATLKAAELHGVLFKQNDKGQEVLDPGAVARFETNMLAMAAISRGQTGPMQILAMMRAAGVSAKMMTDANGFAEMMPMMTAMGPERAGTGLRGFSQEFSAGKMSNAGLDILTEMGIIADPTKVKKLGMGQKQLMPGAMGTGDVENVRDHPEAFILDRIVPALDKWLAQQYGDTFSKGDDKTRLGFESQGLQMLASRIPGGDFMAQVAANWPLIARDVGAMKRATGSDPNSPPRDLFSDLVDHNPLMRVQGFKASMDALMITLGNDNMAASIATLKALTGALNHLNEVFMANPNLGSNMMMLANAIAVIGTAIGGVLPLIAAVMGAKSLLKWAVPGAAGAGAAGTAGAGIFAEGAAAGILRLLGVAIKPIAVGAVTKAAVDRADPNDAMGEWSMKHLFGYEWAQRKIDHAAGYSDDDFDKYYHRGKYKDADAAGGKTDLTVNLHVDGKLQSSQTIKGITDAANGPLTGIGGFDAKRSYTPTGLH